MSVISERAKDIDVSEEKLTKAVEKFIAMLSDEELKDFVEELSCSGCGCGSKSC